MSEEIQTEIEKRIDEAAIEFEKQAFRIAPYEETDLSDAFRAGAKFILEMPEMKEAMVVIKSYLRHDCDCYEGFTCMPCEVLCALKKAGLCE